MQQFKAQQIHAQPFKRRRLSPVLTLLFLGIAAYSQLSDAQNAFTPIFPGGGNFPPLANITSPTDNQAFTTADNVIVSVEAGDFDGNVARVEFRLDGGAWFSDTAAPYSRNFGTLSTGTHTLEARALDNGNLYSLIISRQISVSTASSGGSSGTGGSGNTDTSARRVVFLHTDALGSPAAETNQQGSKQ
ncbi:hypothetical protein EYS14_02325 [Alteromonadaceae bacterium M269]|nr:hypothetical protein EYS14_02325 [Alteromonadaceae bacterium M269]